MAASSLRRRVMSIAIDLTGQRFGRLTPIRIGERQGSSRMWICVCDCGRENVVRTAHLLGGRVKSCGCLNSEMISAMHLRHGRTHTPEHKCWIKMRERCRNPKDISYKYYGAKGVTVCERWNQFESFFEDMGLKPSPKHSIDRIDPYGNYEPSNCRWADSKTQSTNKRRPM